MRSLTGAARPSRLTTVPLPALVRREPLLVALVLLAAIAYAVYAVSEQNHFLTDLDLAVRDQAIWLYSRFEEPRITTIRTPVHVLGDHFSPINILLAPLYWIWADPRALLIAQGLLVAASIVPVFLFARDRLGRVGADVLAAAYAAFWGIGAAVSYQFHDIAFAPLLIALAILFADRGRWRAFYVSVGLLILVQENMPILVAFIGLWLISGGERRRGLITAALGVVSFVLITELAMPAFAGGEFRQWSYTAFGSDLPSSLVHIAGHPWQLLTEIVDEPEKRRTLAYLFLPFMLLVFASRLAILCIPLLAQQMFSSRPEFWGTDFHYWLPIAPVLAMGTADGLRNLARRLGDARSLRLAVAAVTAVILATNLVLAERFQLSNLFRPGFSLAATADDRTLTAVIEVVPSDASVTAPAHLAPHMTERKEVHLLGYPGPATEYVVFSPGQAFWPDPEYASEWLRRHRPLYAPVYAENGWVVWRRAS